MAIKETSYRIINSGAEGIMDSCNVRYDLHIYCLQLLYSMPVYKSYKKVAFIILVFNYFCNEHLIWVLFLSDQSVQYYVKKFF